MFCGGTGAPSPWQPPACPCALASPRMARPNASGKSLPRCSHRRCRGHCRFTARFRIRLAQPPLSLRCRLLFRVVRRDRCRVGAVCRAAATVASLPPRLLPPWKPSLMTPPRRVRSAGSIGTGTQRAACAPWRARHDEQVGVRTLRGPFAGWGRGVGRGQWTSPAPMTSCPWAARHESGRAERQDPRLQRQPPGQRLWLAPACAAKLRLVPACQHCLGGATYRACGLD